MIINKLLGLFFVFSSSIITYCYFSDVWPGRVFFNTIFADLLLIIGMTVIFLFGVWLFVGVYNSNK